MEDILLLAVLLLFNGGMLAVLLWFMRKQKFSQLSELGVARREQTEQEDRLFLGALKIAFDTCKKEDGTYDFGIFLKQKVPQIAMQHPQAAARIPKSVIQFFERVMRLMERFEEK